MDLKNSFLKTKIFYYAILFLFFFAIILLFTHGLFNNFFEQDEWGAFGDAIYSYNLPWWSFLITKGIHFGPFALLFWLGLYKLFALNATYYIFIELFLHAIASFLVYLFITKISNHKRVGFLTALLFATDSRDSEAFMHLAVFSTTITSFIFIMLFFIYLLSIKSKYFSIKNIVILMCLFFSSVFFREDGFMLVPLFIVYLLVFDKGKINKKNVRAFIYWGMGLVLFLILRVSAQALNTIVIPKGTSFDLNATYYNLLTLPAKLVVQNIISGNTLLLFLVNNISNFYPNMPSVTQTYPLYMDIAFFFLFILFMSVFLIWAYFWQNKKKRLYIIFFVLWIIVDSIYLSAVGRQLYYLDSYYLYFSSVPILFFISYFALSIFSAKNKTIVISLLGKFFAIAIISLFLFVSYEEIHLSVQQKVTSAYARRTVMQSIKKVYPTLPNNTIFYVKCKETCYYNSKIGLSPQWVLPFSSGPGWNLLVMYSVGHEKIWGKFLTNDFLLNLGSQGYKKIGNYSFGYFIDKSKLEKTLKENKINKDTVIAFEYNEADFSVTDISQQFRKQLDEK